MWPNKNFSLQNQNVCKYQVDEIRYNITYGGFPNQH